MFKRWLFSQSDGAWWQDRVSRELQGLETALAQGIARRMALVNRALREANTSAVILYREEMERFLEAARAVSALPAQAQAVLDSAKHTSEVQPAQAGVVPTLPEEITTYCISSAILAEAYAHLTQRLPGANQEPEWMLAVTGLVRGRLRTLEHLIDVKLATQTGVQASFDMQAFTRIALTLHEHGQALHAVFHSHRFPGPPHPSGTDDRLQHLLEEGGYPAIQAVFSEDGFVRFFASQRRFAVEVYGKGVEAVDPARFLYRIVQFGTLPHPPPRTQEAGRGGGVRPLPTRTGR